MKNLIWVLVIIIAAGLQLKSQDTIILKTHDTLLVKIIKFDNQKVFFVNIKSQKESVSQLNMEKVEAISFAGQVQYGFAPEKTGTDSIVNIKEVESSYFFDNDLGIMVDILPSFGASIDMDVGDKKNISLGMGLHYFTLGGKIFVKQRNIKKMLFLGAYYYYFTHVEESKHYINLVVGEELRKKNGFNFRFEGGFMLSTDEVFPMIKIGIGKRFKY